MEIDNIVSCHQRYAELQKDVSSIVFYKCTEQLKELFRKSCFLSSYIIQNDLIIIFHYDLHTFPTPSSFYNYIINAIAPAVVNSFSYSFCDTEHQTETYTILHNSSHAELIVYYDDLAINMGSDAVEFNIDGVHVYPKDFPINTLHNMSIIFKYIINYIDTYDIIKLLNNTMIY